MLNATHSVTSNLHSPLSSRYRNSTMLLVLGQLVLLLALAPGSSAMWPFGPKRGNSEALFNAGSMGLPGDSGRVVALGDIDGDQNSDLFVLSRDRKSVRAWQWKRSAFKYEPEVELTFDHEIVNVVPADFNGDGRLDLLVMTMVGSKGGMWSSNQLHTDLEVVLTGPGGLGTGERWKLPPSELSQPIVYDDDGYLIPSLLGYFKTDEGPKVQSWRNNGSYIQVSEPPMYNGEPCQLAVHHSSAFIDMDGDCAPDVVLHCRSSRANDRKIQIWTADPGDRGDNGFSLAKTFDLPSGTRSLSYADMNRNGAMDIIFAQCKSAKVSTGRGSDCSINVVYNQQAGLCSGATSQYERLVTYDHVKGQKQELHLKCRGTAQLCTADSAFDFDFDGDGEGLTTVPISELFGKGVDLLISLPKDQNVPLPIRPGDFDLDGYPDLLLTLTDGKSSFVRVVRNVPCSKGVAGCSDNPSANARGFVVASGKGWEALESISDAVGASWIDIDDDGSLDILVQRTGEQDEQTVTFLQNNFYHDAFFLKAQVLNGACDRDCRPTDGSKPYSSLGVGYSGATFTFTAFDTSGNRHAQKVPQLPQTAYHALLSPHAFIGLGRTNNYVENLEVGTSASKQRATRLEALIPNSQVIINPPWPRARRDDDPVTQRSKEWRTELFLHPGDWIPWVAAAVIGTVVTLAMVVVWLGEREKREDENERRRALHAINFQAL